MRRRDCIPRGVQARLRGDRVKKARLYLSPGPVASRSKIQNAPAVKREAEEDWAGEHLANEDKHSEEKHHNQADPNK